MGLLDFFRSGFSGSTGPEDSPQSMSQLGVYEVGYSSGVTGPPEKVVKKLERPSITMRADGNISQTITSCKGASVAMKNGKLVVKLQPGGSITGSLTKSGQVFEFEITS